MNPSLATINLAYLRQVLSDLLAIPSPTGRTDEAVRYVAAALADMGIPFELTRRGAIRADIKGQQVSPDRAVVAHLDTLGAMVAEVKGNGRLRVVPIGHWSGRFAEGARVTLFTDTDTYRGTILPLKASGHVYGPEIDAQPSGWDQVELRLDVVGASQADLTGRGVNVGDFIAVDAQPEFGDHGFINARHLDDKAGVACVLAAAEMLCRSNLPVPVDCHLLFTISEEVGSGASHILHGDVAEMVAVDNATVAPGQSSCEMGVTVAIMDSSGPFDYHLTRKLLDLCSENRIVHSRDVFRHYRTDAAAAVEAGNDIRTALLCFGVDASHGYERVHMQSLAALSRLLALYVQSPPTSRDDRYLLRPPIGAPAGGAGRPL